MRSDMSASAAIGNAWPPDDLELVSQCPYCGSSERILAHPEVQDWSFYCAAGKWTYWTCAQCDSLYLDPRPTPETLGRAYLSYYTHESAARLAPVRSLKQRLANEYWSHELTADLQPRLNVPRYLRSLFKPLRSRLVEPFVLAELVRLQPGKLMDVGCGNGHMVAMAEALGWEATGLEVDPVAAGSARACGLNVLEGSYTRLAEFERAPDCIICSHVLEHVHDPNHMLLTLARALKSGGTLLLASPNATSLVRRYFGDDWRGLEAPRHLSIPSARQLVINLRAIGFSVTQRPVAYWYTVAESSRIRRRAGAITSEDKRIGKEFAARVKPADLHEHDFVELVCVKNA